MDGTALVTGANRGLGLETCRQLVGRGFRVVLTARDEGNAAHAAEELANAAGDVVPRVLDVADAESISALASALEGDGVSIDVLVNNAGIAPRGVGADLARRTLDVNFYGAMHVTDALLPLIPDGGTIVMVSSGLGTLSNVSPALRDELLDPSLTRDRLVELMESFVRAIDAGTYEQEGWPASHYRVSKVGLNALTRILARELADRGIRVNAVCPGWVRTDMGGSGATRGVAEGAASIVWAAALERDGPTGGFFRDGIELAW